MDLVLQMLLIVFVGCSSITYTSATREIKTLEIKNICDSLYLMTNFSDISMMHLTTAQDWLRDSVGNIKSSRPHVYYEFDVRTSGDYEGFVPNYIENKTSKHFKCKSLDLEPCQTDSIKVRFLRMIKILNSQKRTQFKINLSDLGLYHQGHVLIYYTEMQNKDHDYIQRQIEPYLYGRVPESGFIYSHVCVLNLSDGQIEYYKYHFDYGLDTDNPSGIFGIYSIIGRTIDKLIDPFMKDACCRNNLSVK